MRAYLDIQFKGDRNYLHGTDIFNNIMLKIEEQSNKPINNIDFAFKKKVVNKLYYSVGKPLEGEDYAITIKYKEAEEQKRIYIYESEIKTEGRYTYPEKTIIDNTVFNAINKNSILKSPTFSNIENIVALNKGLLQGLFPEANGKWYFTRLKLTNNIRVLPASKIEIKLRKNVGFKLTDSEIFLNDKKVGNIYFTLV